MSDSLSLSSENNLRPRALMKGRRDQCLSSGLWKCSQHRATASELRLVPNRIRCVHSKSRGRVRCSGHWKLLEKSTANFHGAVATPVECAVLLIDASPKMSPPMYCELYRPCNKTLGNHATVLGGICPLSVEFQGFASIGTKVIWPIIPQDRGAAILGVLRGQVNASAGLNYGMGWDG